MDALLHDWLSLLVRWLHIITGIAWIGSSFYFVWLDLSLRKREGMAKGVNGESWAVHGGGFYHVQKYMVAPERMPDELHWFKWESYMTWISGFALLAIVYYWGAESYMIDRSVLDIGPATAIAISVASLAVGWVVYDLLCHSPLKSNQTAMFAVLFVFIVASAYGYGLVFSGRAAFLHVGAMIATMMTANVFMIIIPKQKIVVADLVAGRTPDPALGAAAKLRSTHNNYLTLPVLFMMISNHYPMTFGHEWNWAIVALVLAAGAIIRNYFNVRNAGGRGSALAWQWPAATILTIALIAFTAWKPGGEIVVEDEVLTPEAVAIVQTRCLSCHATNPSDEDFDEAPGGAIFETADQVKARAQKILAQAVLSKAMPLGNKTAMTDEERARLGAWIRAGMPDE
ncbi:urate hydroxylase PuuD [Oceanibacterium hippocampi]|uniref:Cytochrome c n=1 Tax=Oceanibacterium hippocampi TaxID=745714 RepID=A0A1Y5TXA8_9PROT|nr:urate hydroxylase PuuD [Oceanibacterium hippocampi]SLN76059.1 Cytochrome c [Oceanibacterium hippocampi]